MLLYSGINSSPGLLGHESLKVEKFSPILLEDIISLIGAWNYLLIIQKNGSIYLGQSWDSQVKKLSIPDNSKVKSAIGGKECVTILTENHEMWQYGVYKDTWKKICNFVPKNDDLLQEYVVKIDQNSCIMALTNLGRVFSVPSLVEMPKKVKFTDIACGFDHTILLTEDFEIFSMGMNTKGQLGHGDLEDCDDPRLIEALAGLKISQISSGGWHNAAITVDGDLYTWGWSTNGELGLGSESKVVACPTLIDFINGDGEIIDVRIKKVQCGNNFTICMTDDGALWGCGSNENGQLGQSRTKLPKSNLFVKLEVNLEAKDIDDFYCKEWGSTIVVR